MFNALFGIKQLYLHHKQSVEQIVQGAVISTHNTFDNDFIPFYKKSTKLKTMFNLQFI